MKQSWAVIAVGMVAAAVYGAVPRPRLVREIRMDSIIRESEGLDPSTHSVQALVFSPNEEWIAAGVGLHYKPGTTNPMEFSSHVVVLPVRDGGGLSLQLEADARVAQGSLVWSPDSSVLVVNDDRAPRNGTPFLQASFGSRVSRTPV